MALQTRVEKIIKPALVSTPGKNGLLQRKCSRCNTNDVDNEHEDDQKKHLVLQRRAASEGDLTGVPPIVHDVLRSSGEPLDSETRAFMEPRFGHDFSKVRIHTDEKAAKSTRILGALAYSVDQQIVFGKKHFSPWTLSGRQLLAHELAHVAQMDGKQTVSNGIASLSSQWERDASRAASVVTQGQPYMVSRGAPSQIYLVADLRLGTHLMRLRELSREMAGPLRREYVVDQLLAAVSGLDLSDPDNLNPVTETISQSFSTSILLEFLELVESSRPRRREPTPAEEAQMEQTLQAMQVRRRGPYGQYGPGVAIPVMSHADGPLMNAGRSISAYFEGLLEGLHGSVSDADIQALSRQLIGSSVVNIVLPVVIASGAAVGIAEDIVNAIRGFFEIIGNISEIVQQMLDLLKLMVSEEGVEVARTLGNETGRNYANRVRDLTRLGPIRFTYELGRLIGPMVVYTVLSIVTAGAVAGVAVSARLASLLSRFPRFARILERIGSRLRRLRRRGQPDIPERLQDVTDKEIESALEHIESPRTTGPPSRPRIEGDPIPKRKVPRLEDSDIPLHKGENLIDAVDRIKRIIGRRISDYPEILAAWNKALARVRARPGGPPSDPRKLFEAVRDRFWQEIRDDDNASQRFLDSGFTFANGRAAQLDGVPSRMPRQEITVSLDHAIEIRQDPTSAVDPKNLVFEFSGPNSFREIVQMRHPALRSSP